MEFDSGWDGAVSGVIDWTDAHLGDPAIDLAWALFGTAQEFAAALAETYGVSGKLGTVRSGGTGSVRGTR